VVDLSRANDGTMPLNPKVTINTGGIHGRCWFAKEPIAEGELIWWPEDNSFSDGIFVDLDTILSWPKEKQELFWELAYQVGENRFHGFVERYEDLKTDQARRNMEENFVNHCCDGNAWYEGDDRLVAKRDIKAGEEICYDYALTECHSEFRLQCRCNSSNCRKIVTGDDWKLPELQAAYGDHFLPHILKLIQQQKEKAAESTSS
jgi:hypothetical protein